MKKTMLLLIAGIVLVLTNQTTFGQSKPSVAVLHIDTRGLGYEPDAMGHLVRLELEKLNLYEVVDRYDVDYLIKKNQIDVAGCYGKICLVEIGKQLKVNKMFSGSVEMMGEKIIIQLRLVDVQAGVIESTLVKEFLNLPKNLQEMIQISIAEMFSRPSDKEVERQLTASNDLENFRNNPGRYRLQNDGPRMGFAFLTGSAAETFKGPKIDGGYGHKNTLMFQFGYQFEKQYLNEGRYQMLVEFLPMITGIDKQLFIPSLTFMNGIRDNKSGWEFGFGPNFNVVRYKNGYVDRAGVWYDNPVEGIEMIETKRFDSRGTPSINAGFILAVGKTFRSGKLNIPINAYFVPSNNGSRIGLSFGFNAKNDDRYKDL